VAEQAERLGFDSVWVNDHVYFTHERMRRSSSGVADAQGQPDPNYFESLTTLAAVAGRCEKIWIGVHGLILPIRDPRLFAKQVATIHELSGGRLIIAPAIGGFREDFDLMQVPFERRGRLLDEHLAVLDAIFHQPHPLSYAGPHIRFENATLYPIPQGLRIFVTGESEPALRRVVRWGDGWFTSYPALKEYVPKITRLRELASESGRDPDAIDTGATCFVRLDDTREQAVEIVRPSAEQRWGSLERGFEKAAIGTADDVLAHLRERYDAGLRYVELKFFARSVDELLEMIERFAAEVLPPLRSLRHTDGGAEARKGSA
jgi:probable F420-dependent oxidoreductase